MPVTCLASKSATVIKIFLPIFSGQKYDQFSSNNDMSKRNLAWSLRRGCDFLLNWCIGHTVVSNGMGR